MAHPQQYAGLAGASPGVSAAGVVQEGVDSYRETWRAQPFGAAGTGGIGATQTQIPGRERTATVTVLASCTRGTAGTGPGTPAAGTRKQILSQTVTQAPPPKVEYGRISEN